MENNLMYCILVLILPQIVSEQNKIIEDANKPVVIVIHQTNLRFFYF